MSNKKLKILLGVGVFSVAVGVSSVVAGAVLMHKNLEQKTNTKLDDNKLIAKTTKATKTTNQTKPLNAVTLPSQNYNPDLSINLNGNNSTVYAQQVSSLGSVNNANNYYGAVTSSSVLPYKYVLSVNGNNFSFNGTNLPFWTANGLKNTINSSNFSQFMSQTVWSNFIDNVFTNLPASDGSFQPAILQALDNVTFTYTDLIVTNSNDNVNTNLGTSSSPIYNTISAWNNLQAVTGNNNQTPTSTAVQNGVLIAYTVSFPSNLTTALSTGVFTINNKTIDTGASFLKWLGLNTNDITQTGASQNSTASLAGTLAINNLAVAINNNSLAYWPGLNSTNTNNATIDVPTNQTSSYFVDLFKYDSAWLFNSNNINFNITQGNFNSYIDMQNYVLNSLFATNDVTVNGILQTTTTANNEGLVTFNSVQEDAQQTSNLTDEQVNNASVTNASLSNILLGNSGYYFGANSTYAFSSAITATLSNYRNSKDSYVLPSSITLTNLNYEDDNQNSFINAINLTDVPGNLKYWTAYQTWFNYFFGRSYKQTAISLFKELSNYANNISASLLNPLGISISNPVPSLVLQNEFISGISGSYIIIGNSLSNKTGYTNASSFYLNISINNLAYQNRFIEFANNNLNKNGTYFLVNNNIFNNMSLASISSSVLNDTSTLPFNSIIGYNFNVQNYLPTTLNLKNSDVAVANLAMKNYSQLKNVLGATWQQYLQDYIENTANAVAKTITTDNLEYSYYFGTNSQLSLGNSGYSLSQKDGNTYLTVPIENLANGNAFMVNGVIIPAKSTGYVNIQLTGFIQQFNAVWAIVAVVLVMLFVMLVLGLFVWNRNKKGEEARGLSNYFNKLDKWRNKYFKEYEDFYSKKNEIKHHKWSWNKRKWLKKKDNSLKNKKKM